MTIVSTRMTATTVTASTTCTRPGAATDKMYDKTRQAGNYAKDTAMKAENATKNGLDKAAGKVEEFGSKIKDATKDGISKAADKVKETTDRMADKVQNKMR